MKGAVSVASSAARLSGSTGRRNRGIKTFHFFRMSLLTLFVSPLKARELGLRFDLTLGSGWPFGGPFVPLSDAAETAL